MKQTLVLIICFIAFFPVLGQEKRKIGHRAYDEWKSIRNLHQSPTGIWVSYEVAVLQGDADLVIESVERTDKRVFPRGKNAVFMSDESVAVFMIEPQYDTLRRLKLDETPKDQLPKDSLAIHWIGKDSTVKIANVKSFQVAEDNTWIAYLSTRDLRVECPKNQSKRQKKKNPCHRPPTSGFTLTIYNPSTGTSHQVDGVTNYLIDQTGKYVACVKSHKGDADTLSFAIINLTDFTELQLLDKRYAIPQFKFDEDGTQLAVIASGDTNKLKNFELYRFDPDWLFYGQSADRMLQNIKPDAAPLVDSLTPGMPEGWTVSEHGRLFFSQDGSQLFFGTNKIVIQGPEDTLLDSEKAQVDIWGAYDARIQPQQLNEQSSDEKRSYQAVFFRATGSFVQLTGPEMQGIRLTDKGNGYKALGIDETPYQRESTWEYPWKSDYYLIDVNTGQRTLLKKGHGFAASLSPSGHYFVYYNAVDSAWYAINTETNEEKNLSGGLHALFASDNNGNPSLADEEGFIGWTLLNGEELCLVNSRYDIWALHPSDPEKSFSPTAEKGVTAGVRFGYYRLDSDSTYTNLPDNFFVGVNDLTKAETIYRIVPSGNGFDIDALITSDHTVVSISKAEKSDRVILRRMNFTEYPDLEKTTTDFSDPVKFTEVNPQQSLYNWGTVEMVSWQSFEGRNLRGLLYKPEDFDSTRSYPMIVYFYEKYTQDIHLYYAPKPTASIVYPTEYVSNGYIIFIPDIEYTPGYPAKSAYDCIVSGTDYLIRKYHWIDSTRLGLQGQSWGGYQTAQLITMTDKYKAAMAGAPVSNMTSAYGGIRWGSGLSRMFQYEKTQSRIGYTLWEKPELYLVNSPVFGLPKVKTPLLIMSNDGDGAVPWYQGIELYMGLRRLGQPVWLLNYNGDEHNLIQLANKRDLSIRMRQFFDYYLLGAPMPVWMSQGVPATEKGTNYGFGLENTDH